MPPRRIGNVSGAITITLDRDEVRIRVGVEETGSGMDEPIRSCLRAILHDEKRLPKGPVWALAIVHGIVSAPGGMIDVRSRRGAGSVPEVSLGPLKNSPPTEAGQGGFAGLTDVRTVRLC